MSPPNRGIPYQEALSNLDRLRLDRRLDAWPVKARELLEAFHPDYQKESQSTLPVGPNLGQPCHRDLGDLLSRNALIDESDLEGRPLHETEVLVVGAGGAGCAAAYSAAERGAKVLLVTKLTLGDSNTVMAESGIQAALHAEDSLQDHFDDSFHAGHKKAVPALLAQMVTDGPEVIRWLIQLGMNFDRDGSSPFSNLSQKRVGGIKKPRVLSYGDGTGLELMKVLREAVRHHPSIEVWSQCPVVELLSDDQGCCGGAVLFDTERRELKLVRSRATILATGGLGRLHVHNFPTSNHFGATGDGLLLAYRLGAQLRHISSLQYHPTGLAHPAHLKGMLVPEAARSAGAKLVNGLGERFVDELSPRDVVAAAIIGECQQGRGVLHQEQVGVFLDLPGLLLHQADVLERFPALVHLAHKCRLDLHHKPFLVYPTLHYQNGGLAIDGSGATSVPHLFCCGEVSGGIHGHNRLAGNALLEILAFGRRTGWRAAQDRHRKLTKRVTIDHLHRWQRELTQAGLPLDRRGPVLYPTYANFSFRDYLETREFRAKKAQMQRGEGNL